MAENRLRAVVATSTLDLGIAWGDVDLVVPCGGRRREQAGLRSASARANHRMDEPSPRDSCSGHRFEVMECQAALDANYVGAQDTPSIGKGALDVAGATYPGMACAQPFDALELYDEVISAAPYARLPWETFERAVDLSPPAVTRFALTSAMPASARRRTGSGGSPTRWLLSNTASMSGRSSNRRC